MATEHLKFSYFFISRLLGYFVSYDQVRLVFLKCVLLPSFFDELHCNDFDLFRTLFFLLFDIVARILDYFVARGTLNIGILQIDDERDEQSPADGRML